MQENIYWQQLNINHIIMHAQNPPALVPACPGDDWITDIFSLDLAIAI